MITPSNNYTITEISNLIKGSFIQQCTDTAIISHLGTDSRQIAVPENTLFFALNSKRNDGHKYIGELYDLGVRNFVISHTSFIHLLKGKANVILVKDTLKALQSLCAAHRSHYKLPVLAITGSNGKTIVKEWLFQLLSPDMNIVRSPKSYNSQIGVPLSVWQINDTAQLGIFEAGISEPDEMEALKHIIKPDIGLFTNIGHAHDENFINRQQKIGEKLKLFTQVDTLIYCSDYTDIQEVIIKSALLHKIKFFTWSRKNDANLKISQVIRENHNTRIEATYNGIAHAVTIPFNDDASVENAINCWCFMLLQGYTHDVIASRLRKLTGVAMRLELKEGINNCTIINDSYNSDINSLTIALDFLTQQNQHPRRTLILSDILQSGRNDADLYEEVAALVSQKHINRVIGIGKALSAQAKKFTGDKLFFKSTHDFIRDFPFSEFQNEAILIKGAREFEFEKIMAYLQQKTHQTILEVHLNAIVHNLNYYKSLLQPGVKIMAMVKAFSYGTGSFEIANLLQFNRVDYLGVAFTDEGKELRKAGITLPILVMNPDESGFDDMIKYHLEPEIYNMRMLELFEKALDRNNYEGSCAIHLKLDTGMHRLGFEENDIPQLSAKLNNNKRFAVRSVFSHLASSANSNFDDFTREQFQRYELMCAALNKAVGDSFLMHILNTGGISRFADKQYHMVRLGLGLYGIATAPGEQDNLLNVSVLRTAISQVKRISAGDSVGYDRSFRATESMLIATVPVGYADGLSRKLSNGKGKMRVGSTYVPIIGNVCMDMCMLDVTGLHVAEGDEVVVFDDAYPVSRFAEAMETIPYEVLTGFSRRVKRVYYQE